MNKEEKEEQLWQEHGSAMVAFESWKKLRPGDIIVSAFLNPEELKVPYFHREKLIADMTMYWHDRMAEIQQQISQLRKE